MHARTALIAAIACAGLAVGAVSLDLAYTLTFSLETKDANGDWITMAVFPFEDGRYYAQPVFGCAGPVLRVVVDNARPIGATEDVRAWYHDARQERDVVVLDETWNIGAGEKQVHEFVIPSDAFPVNGTADQRFPGDGGEVSVTATIGYNQIGTCVRANGPDQGVKGATA